MNEGGTTNCRQVADVGFSGNKNTINRLRKMFLKSPG